LFIYNNIGGEKKMITKSFTLTNRDFKKLLSFCTKADFSRHIIVKIYGLRVMIFHSDSYAIEKRANRKKILLFHKLLKKGKVDKFVCCYPEETAIPMEYCFMGANARGEIHHSGDSNKVIFTCAGKRAR
jgi:hypothetical protein